MNLVVFETAWMKESSCRLNYIALMVFSFSKTTLNSFQGSCADISAKMCSADFSLLDGKDRKTEIKEYITECVCSLATWVDKILRLLLKHFMSSNDKRNCTKRSTTLSEIKKSEIWSETIHFKASCQVLYQSIVVRQIPSPTTDNSGGRSSGQVFRGLGSNHDWSFALSFSML